MSLHMSYLSVCCSLLEHRASMKRLVSLQFLNLRQSVGLLGRGSVRLKTATYILVGHIYALSGNRTHETSVRQGEYISCLRPGATVIGNNTLWIFIIFLSPSGWNLLRRACFGKCMPPSGRAIIYNYPIMYIASKPSAQPVFTLYIQHTIKIGDNRRSVVMRKQLKLS